MGDLRLGDYIAIDDDHYGSGYQWYHPECLWKTFTYKKNALTRITSKKQIIGWKNLDVRLSFTSHYLTSVPLCLGLSLTSF